MAEDLIERKVVALNIAKKSQQRFIGATVIERIKRKTSQDEVLYSVELFDFVEDNEHFSALDSFLVQLGACNLYLADDYENTSKGDGRKIYNLMHGKNIDVIYVKKSFFTKKPDLLNKILRLTGKSSHVTNTAEAERPLAYAGIDCLITVLRLLDEDTLLGKYELKFGSLSGFMRLDSAAAEAVNLLPKPDHPSQFGSIYGVLNRCKTKMGARLLDRWLRQPLLDENTINARLDVVEVLKKLTVHRNQLLDGPLKAAPDLDLLMARMQKRSAGLEEVFRLYAFTKALPGLVGILADMTNTFDAESFSGGGGKVEAAGTQAEGSQQQQQQQQEPSKTSTIRAKYLAPIESLSSKFEVYQQLVEHVVDMEQLPNFEVNPQHDPQLKELRSERDQLEDRANRLLAQARSGWASFADIRLERNAQHGFIFRSTRGDDERQLRASNSAVRVLSLQKNGVHFTTPELEKIADRTAAIDEEYQALQQELVARAVETALTYLPVAEAAAALVAEVDVLASFATAAALAPGEYVRPVLRPRGEGVMDFQGARHPCVELMDGVDFIANDYDLRRGESGFQIVTGPNMGGKSTYIRGLGAIAVMAQVGSFVPCSRAELSPVDCILARVGAGDAVQKGVSTFMAEMLEASVILQTATRDSLLIIDELGRGTSTFDGFGLAWAISEYIVTRLDCLCLFATHFHELTALANKHRQKGVVNKHVTAQVSGGELVMLYSVRAGACSESFGVHVATMAQFPPSVIGEAKRKAAELEAGPSSARLGPCGDSSSGSKSSSSSSNGGVGASGESVKDAAVSGEDADRDDCDGSEKASKHRRSERGEAEAAVAAEVTMVEFSALPMEELAPAEIKAELGRLFPPHAIVA